MRTLGQRVFQMDPPAGFAAQATAGAVIYASTQYGYPLSTTHVVSGAVMGAGATKRLSAVRWGVAGNIVFAWVLTIPAAAVVAALVWLADQGDLLMRVGVGPGERRDLHAARPGGRGGARGDAAVEQRFVEWPAGRRRRR